MSFQSVLILLLIGFFLYILLLPRQLIFRKAFVLILLLMMLAVSFQPAWSQRIANWFGVGRGVDFLFYLSHITLFFIALVYYLKLKNMEIRFTKLVRQLAIIEANQGTETTRSTAGKSTIKT